MPKSTDKKFTAVLNTPEHPTLTQDATALAKRKGYHSLAGWIRVMLINELAKETPDTSAPK